ncbi:protein-disulfide reductase DsbD family protein [Sphingomonas morindae]|uniref:Thioredoxin family protein n=1 Tax=Sphingomonas morindae TaxID=1541170 RepID=A0ABY4X549_9SPHN|nr:protein-disulfide reductase DsbD domain-containing protein [Sphingomonas morindae]USI72029.1 thioredoxin family protein [Sphingomonas morindae]
MTLLRLLLALLAALATAPLVAQAPGGGPHILTGLVPETDSPAAGTMVTLAVTMVPQPGWHGYWRQPGDAGLAPRFTWTVPPGVRADAPLYPVPGTLRVAGLMNHVYEKPFALLVPLHLPAGLARGTRLPIRLALDYLVCTTSLCVPESATLATQLRIGDGAIDPAVRARFDGWRRALPRPLGAEARVQRVGATVRLALPLPAAVALPAPHLFVASEGVVAPGAAQRFSRAGDRLTIETGAAPGTGAPWPATIEAVLAPGDGSGLAFTARPGVVAAPPPPAPAPAGPSFGLILAALGGAVLGGLLLNIMPCVFPILSLKALKLARAGGSERQVRREALAYAAGVILVCTGLGAVLLALRATGGAVGWAFQLQDPGVIAGLALLTAAIGLNLAGLFEFGAVSAGEGLAASGGAAGAFWTGALAAFVATPCTGPFMAAALGAALVLPAAAALAIFAGLGLGLALPFLALGFVPALRRALPRPGAWMERFRHVLAVPMLLTALGLCWVLGREAGADAIIVALGAVLLLALGLWITGQRQRRLARAAWLPAGIGVALAAALLTAAPRAPAGAPAVGAAPADGATRFDADRLAALTAENRPVFLYFTADWCLSCKVNEAAAIDRAETRAAFRRAGVVTMVGDWTRGDPAIGRFLEAHGRSGVPLYLWYAPGKPPRVLPQLLSPALLTGLVGGG